MATLVFNPIDRDRLFYDQYEYCFSFRMMFASLLRCKAKADIPKVAEHRNQWRGRWQKSAITDADVRDLMDMHDRLENLGKDHHVVIYSNNVYVYCNDSEKLAELTTAEYIVPNKGTRALLTIPRNRVLLFEPKHRYRTYFKERYKDTEPLRKFLLARKDCFSYTNNLAIKLTYPDRFFVQRHYFVDHDDPKDALMLNIVCPGIVRETLPIEAK